MRNIIRIILLIGFVIFYTGLLAQIKTFEYSLSTPNDEKIFDIHEDINGNIYFCGGTSTTPNLFNSSLITVKIDRYGNELNSNIYSIENKSLFARQLIPSDSNGFIITAILTDTLRFNPSICLYNLDFDLNLDGETIYNFNPNYLFWDTYSMLLNNGNIISSISLQLYPNMIFRSYNYIFNSNFDSIHSVYYSSESRAISHMRELPNNNIWSLNMLLGKYEILDQNYNIIETQKVPENLIANYGVSWDSDSSFYLLGKDSFQSNRNGQNLAYIKQFNPIDTSGYLYNYWRFSDTVDFPATWNGVALNNKDSVFIGGTENLDFYSPWYGNHPSWFVIIQTDSLLNKRWERFYGGDAYYVMTNLIASNDGGCIVAGTRYDYLNTTEQELDIVILKLNNEGLITNIFDQQSERLYEAIVYPNPGISEINIRIAAQYKESKFELFDFNGHMVISKKLIGNNCLIETDKLNAGSYIYSITNNKGLNETGIWIKQ